MKNLTALALTFTCLSAPAEQITYEIHELRTDKFIASGTKNYTSEDLIINSFKRKNRQVTEKFIELEKGYKIGARIFIEPKLTGFGLLAQKTPKDFSWEWYNLDSGSLFQKLQGGTFVEVKVSGLPSAEILSEVAFIDDTKLGFILERQGREDTHEIIIKKGSILKLE